MKGKNMSYLVSFGISLYKFRQKYVRCFSREDYEILIRTVLSDTDSILCFRASLMCGSFQNLIGSLFVWSDTPQGGDYWCSIDCEWNRYIESIS
jgi:hypothetical protein